MFEIKNAIDTENRMRKFDSENPSFITEIGTKKICEVNEEVITGCDNYNPIGKRLGDIIHIEDNISQNIIAAFFNNQWYILEQETILWEGSPHLKVRLQKRTNIPDFDTIHTLNNMIGFLLHRIRSPLTGIQGYADLMKDTVENNTAFKHIKKIDEGVEELFKILDELEILENIPEKSVQANNFSANPEETLQKVLSPYDTEKRQKISLSSVSDKNIFCCNPGDLRRILSILVENAILHAPAADHQISISQPSSNSIKISHDGTPIPKSISDELFYPFVTTKARRVGIGLTIAMLYAKRYRGSIFLTDNKPYEEVSFTLCLPPSTLSQTSLLF